MKYIFLGFQQKSRARMPGRVGAGVVWSWVGTLASPSWGKRTNLSRPLYADPPYQLIPYLCKPVPATPGLMVPGIQAFQPYHFP